MLIDRSRTSKLDWTEEGLSWRAAVQSVWHSMGHLCRRWWCRVLVCDKVPCMRMQLYFGQQSALTAMRTA